MVTRSFSPDQKQFQVLVSTGPGPGWWTQHQNPDLVLDSELIQHVASGNNQAASQRVAQLLEREGESPYLMLWLRPQWVGVDQHWQILSTPTGQEVLLIKELIAWQPPLNSTSTTT